MSNNMKGAFIAGAVASMFLAGTAHAGDKAKEGGKTVKCSASNACKGQGACKGASNACKGQNGCKGQGWQEAASAKDCTAKGGKVIADAK